MAKIENYPRGLFYSLNEAFWCTDYNAKNPRSLVTDVFEKCAFFVCQNMISQRAALLSVQKNASLKLLNNPLEGFSFLTFNGGRGPFFQTPGMGVKNSVLWQPWVRKFGTIGWHTWNQVMCTFIRKMISVWTLNYMRIYMLFVTVLVELVVHQWFWHIFIKLFQRQILGFVRVQSIS